MGLLRGELSRAVSHATFQTTIKENNPWAPNNESVHPSWVRVFGQSYEACVRASRTKSAWTSRRRGAFVKRVLHVFLVVVDRRPESRPACCRLSRRRGGVILGP